MACTGCNWISLAANALTYPTLQSGEVGNVVATDSIIYAARGASGLLVIDSRTGTNVDSLLPPAGAGSIDDIAIDGDLLFILDAEPPGFVAVYSLGDPRQPKLTSLPRQADVGPFSGISAADGTAMVSGGTSTLTVWQYNSAGDLQGPLASTDLGRGQPAILVRPSGLSYVSTHFWGPYFGVDVLRYDTAARSIKRLGRLELDGAGFTAGGSKPANFPIDVAVLAPDTLLVAFARGVAVVDWSNPSAPRTIQVVNVGGRAVSIDVRERTAAVGVASRDPAVVIVDFSKPSTPATRRISLPPGTKPAGVAFTGARVAVAARSRGVILVDR